MPRSRKGRPGSRGSGSSSSGRSSPCSEIPLTPFFFDPLHLDGRDWIDAPARERIDALGGAVPGLTIPRRLVTDPKEAEAFLEESLAGGHEGIMAKSVAAPYEAGRR